MRVSDPLREGADDDLFAVAAPFVRVVDDVFGADECDAVIARIESLRPAFAPVTTSQGFVEMPELRNNDRVIFDDVDLAADLWRRLQRLGPGPRAFRAGTWNPLGLNERFRGYRYRAGQRFGPHYDGAFVRDADERSFVTVIVYLNDGCVGGATNVLDWGVKVEPRRGRVLLFDHPILHEGAVVDGGVKYALRSDVMYRRAP